MQRQRVGFIALITAIMTSLFLLRSGLQVPLVLSLVTVTLLAMQLRLAPQVPPLGQDAEIPLQVMHDLNQQLQEAQVALTLAQNDKQLLEQKTQELLKNAKSHDSEDAAVLMFLRLLQEKSRLLDFALTDITQLPDMQIGAAARVVHQGLRSVLVESFDILPIAGESEGQSLSLPDDFDGTRYRLLQQSAAADKPQGIVLHRGWEVQRMNLPRSLRRTGDLLPSVLAPAEIEAREVLS